jgi:archaellum component FlaC
MDFGGFTLAQIVGGASECQLIKIEIKKYIQAQADAFSKQIADLQTEAIAQRRAAEERESELQAQNENLQKQLFQATLELQEMTNNRDAAAKELSEAKQEVERLNSHIDDLRKEIAVGARAAINVIDTEEQERQKKELADKIRKERTIYNKEYVDPIKKSRLKAKLAISGETIEFPWTEENKYFVIDETEVQPFRDEYGVALPAIETETVAETDEAGVMPEQFRVDAPPVPAVAPIEHRVANGESGVQEEDAFVTRAEVRAIVQEELAKLGVVKGSAA